MISYKEFDSLEELNEFVEKEKATPINIKQEIRNVYSEITVGGMAGVTMVSNKEVFIMFYSKQN